MVFGQAPPPIEQDKVYNQPCFVRQVSERGCTMKKKRCMQRSAECDIMKPLNAAW